MFASYVVIVSLSAAICFSVLKSNLLLSSLQIIRHQDPRSRVGRRELIEQCITIQQSKHQ